MDENPFSREKMDKVWEEAKTYLRSIGEDPDELVRQAAANLQAWDEGGRVQQGIDPVDDVYPPDGLL